MIPTRFTLIRTICRQITQSPTRTFTSTPRTRSVLPSSSSSSKNEPCDDADADQKARTFLNRLIHGTKEMSLEEILPGPAMANTTHSKMVASGGVIHKFETHQIIPGAREEYEDLVAHYYPIFSDQLGQDGSTFGNFCVQIGKLDTAVHLWEFKGYSGLSSARKFLRAQTEWKEFQRKLGKMLRSRSSDICLPFAFWPVKSPSFKGGVFELRKYQLKPGRLLEWEQNWRRGFECRRQFCEPVGGWFTQLGGLHTVYHLWVYPDLDKRKMSREKAWHVKGWAETVYNTVRLVNHMETNIMEPMQFSKVQ